MTTPSVTSPNSATEPSYSGTGTTHYLRQQQAASRQRAHSTRRAAETTVEAVRYELRTYGIAQLAKPHTQARLADFNAHQITEMVASLRRMQPRYPAITEQLITAIEELKNG